MTYRDLLDAELAHFGEPGGYLSIRNARGEKNRIDDLAQAWIDGDRERVMEYVRARDEQVKSRIELSKSNQRQVCQKKKRKPRKADLHRIRMLRKEGYALRAIAELLRLSLATVYRVARTDPEYVRRRSTTTSIGPSTTTSTQAESSASPLPST